MSHIPEVRAFEMFSGPSFRNRRTGNVLRYTPG
jgi:hypothetical protein